MTNGISAQSPRASLNPGATQDIGGARGGLGDATVEAAPAKPRAGNALKTAWLEVRHFLASLVGMRVSTTRPETVTDAASATQGVLHAMTKRDLDTLDVAGALSRMLQHGGFEQDEHRSGISEGAATLFRPALRDLSDLQLMRLHTNFSRLPAVVEGFRDAATATIMEIDDPDVTAMTAAGKISDFSFINLALRDCLAAEMDAREFVPPEPREGAPVEDRDISLLVRHAIDNGGDLQGAIDAVRADRAQERHDAVLDALEQSGFYTRDAEVPQEAPPPHAPALPDNSALSAPFNEARSGWIVAELNRAYEPQNQAVEQTPSVPVGPTGAFEVTWVFMRDMAGPRDISFAGERLPGTEGSTAENRDAELTKFCQALSDRGLAAGDILAMSRVMNQATPGVVASQFMLDPDNAPGLKLAGGDTVPINANVKGGAWSITPSGTGYEVTFSHRQDLGGATMATLHTANFEFGRGSSLDMNLCFVMERGMNGDLAVTGMRDSSIQIRAFDVDGRQLA